MKKYLFIAISAFLISCEDVINVDLETSEPKLVIDASIDWIKNTPGNEQKIKLSTTTDYYSEKFPTVSGAEVNVMNSTNVIFNFKEIPGTGEYICNDFLPVIGETYTLKITLNGETFTASEKLMGVPNIENNILQNNAGGMSGDELEITYFYQDDASQMNYYLYNHRIPHVKFPLYEVEDDDDSQGGLTPVYFSDEDLKPGDVVNIKLHGISGGYYNYFRKILNASGSDGSPFPTIPTVVKGNIVNQSNSSNFPYGYFRLSEVAVKDYIIN